jgi:DNA-binding SARP family transcriptional activator
MSTISVNLFGKLEVSYEERELSSKLEARKAKELLCYILLHSNRPHTRETLAEILWRDSDATRSRKLFRNILWLLQSTLEVCQQDTEPLLLVDSEWVQVNPKAALRLDTAIFEQTFLSVQGMSGQELDIHQTQDLCRAVNLYSGNLLEGWYEDWCIYERERFHNMYLSLLDKLMDYYEAHHDYETGLIYGLRILCHDRTRERTHRRMMRMYCLAGNRAASLRQYDRCKQALHEELSVKPGRRTTTLYDQIRAGQFDEPTLEVIELDGSLDLIPPPLPELLENLVKLEGMLTEAQSLLQQNTQALQIFMSRQNWRAMLSAS